MRMLMLAVLAIAVLVPVCSVAQVQSQPRSEATANPAGQPEKPPLDFAAATETPGFEEYVRKVIKLTMQEADPEAFVILMAKRKAFFARRAEEQWDNEARVVGTC